MNPILQLIINGVASSGSAAAFSPSSLANVREWTLDGTPYYDAGSPLNSLPVLRSRESYGTYRAPRQGRYYVADGTDDYIAVASLTGSETVVSSGGTGTPSIASGRINLTSGTYWDIVLSNGSHYPCNEESGTTSYDIHANAAHGTITNATLGTFHGTGATRTENRNNVHGYRLSGSVYIPKRLTADLAADGNALTATGQSPYPVATESPCVTFNGTNTYLELETIPANKTAFVFSGWIYVTDKGVSSPQILFESSTNYNSNINAVIAFFDDASGDNTLAFAIRAAVGNLRMRYFNFAAYFGTWVHLAVQIRSDNGAMICSLNGATQVLTNNPTYVSDPTGNLVERKVFIGCRSGGSVAPMNGSIAGLKIDLPTTALTQAELNALFTYSSYVPNFLCLPLQDGPGSSNTNRNLAYYKSDGTYGVISNAIVNGTVANIWANRCQYVEDHSIKYGGRLGAGGEFILGVPDTALCADGNAKTLSAGKHGNPYSRLNLNPFTAAELNGRSLPTALAPTGSLASVTPSDSAFMRSDTDGDDRLIVTDAALTGAELDNMETYIGLVRLVDDDGDFIIDDDTDFLVGA